MYIVETRLKEEFHCQSDVLQTKIPLFGHGAQNLLSGKVVDAEKVSIIKEGEAPNISD